MVSAWQQPFQFRSVIPPSVSVPPASVLSVADPPWSLRMSIGSTVTLPATRSSRLLVWVTVPPTLPLASGPTTVTPLPFITPPLQLRLFVSVRVAVPPNAPLPLSVRPAALLVALMFKRPPRTARGGYGVLA